MYQLYTFLVGIHIFAAIIGLGPILVFNQILKNAGNMNELKNAHKIIGKLNPLSSIGFGLLVTTGLLMGVMNPSLFKTVWYLLALGLFIILGIYSSFTIERKLKSMLNISETHVGENIPQEYIELLNQKISHDWVQNALLITIFILMVFKPGN
ncbi:DUF2269 family protein [Oceanobacillus neutriphilus]|uniref:DUF2269 family protein n=1 Tax=Oceanobacillus neutriphilus TaxID=531815 RepID=A0ABQ2P246_9BACI|nr:DUF2269 family protein [Oceanobacillus neutriphilus]GGP16071.1 hypothetical protein GCM10011346_46580 [Oceanobacillus neutriphilus]